MRRWLALCTFVAALVGTFILVKVRLANKRDLGQATSIVRSAALGEGAKLPPLAGLDLSRIAIDDRGATAPAAAGRTAELTLDPELQRLAAALVAAHEFREASVVLLDVESGRVLAYASHLESGPARDLCVEATAPAASVFKVVTAAALVEHGRVVPDQRQCYSGGEQRLVAADLVDDLRRDRWCTTVAGAMGRSINTVFARLAQKHLSKGDLTAAGRALGFAAPVAFDVPVQPSTLDVPDDALGFARTAAGFWHSTLSPLGAAQMSATIARGGEAMRPRIVRQVVGPEKNAIYTAPATAETHRVLAPRVAQALTAMLDKTVSEGTSFKAFHDRGRSFLGGIAVAGKTGTLSDAQAQRHYTWFTGFAPSKPVPGVKQVAVAVLVVNGPVWRVKANVVARELLRGYFAARGVAGVSSPSVGEWGAGRSTARRSKREAR